MVAAVCGFELRFTCFVGLFLGYLFLFYGVVCVLFVGLVVWLFLCGRFVRGSLITVGVLWFVFRFWFGQAGIPG